MANFAQTIVIGNLGKDPQLFNNDQTKAPVVYGSLGVSGKYPQRNTDGSVMVDASGQKQFVKYTTWYDFEIRGARAVAFAQYHRKGMQVQLIGEMREREYDTKLKPTLCYDAQGQPIIDANGQHFQAYTTSKRKSHYLKVDNWVFQEGKPANSAYGQPAAGTPAVAATVGVAPAAAPVTPAAPATPAAPVAPVVPATTAAPAFNVGNGQDLPSGV